MNDEAVHVPVPSAVLPSGDFGAPLGFALDLVALNSTKQLRVTVYAASNPPGAALAVAAGAWGRLDESGPGPTQPWRGVDGKPCVLGTEYRRCEGTIDLGALPKTPSGSAGLVLKFSGGPAHVYLDDVEASVVGGG